MSAVRYAVMGFLLERPSYPYELTQAFNQQIGPAWQLNHAAVNQHLARLESQGLVERVSSKKTAAGQHESAIYGLTDRGAEEYFRWYCGRTERLRPFRDQMVVKVALARREDLPALLEAFDRQEHLCTSNLHEYSERLRQLVSLGRARRFETIKYYLVLDAANRSLRSDIEWLRDARTRLERFLPPRASQTG